VGSMQLTSGRGSETFGKIIFLSSSVSVSGK